MCIRDSEKEVLFKEDLEAIFGKRKWEDKSEMAHFGGSAAAEAASETIPTIVTAPHDDKVNGE